jgi:hypothetical protein
LTETATATPRRGLFATRRQIAFFAFFILWLCIDISALGLVSQQIHKYGNSYLNYPSGMYYHALGLLLFTSIVGLLYGLFHAWLNLPLMMIIFFVSWILDPVRIGTCCAHRLPLCRCSVYFGAPAPASSSPQYAHIVFHSCLELVVDGLASLPQPFGHGLQCGNPVERFPPNYRPFVHECSRITAISGLAWAMCK